MNKHDHLGNLVLFVDIVLRDIAERNPETRGDISIEEIVAASWDLLAEGHLRLVGDGASLGVETCINRAERRVAAKHNRLLVEFRKRHGVPSVAKEDAA